MAATTAKDSEGPKETPTKPIVSGPSTTSLPDASEIPNPNSATSDKQPPPPSSEDNSKTAGDSEGPVTDVQKKIRRAERFGMPVQLSEEDKRNSRAERFGTRVSVPGSDALKKVEQDKRKARAERFGLENSTSTDEEAKKKARVARFAPIAQIDSVEEDKKKARSIRFSQSQTSSLSKSNGNGKVEETTVIAEEAGGGT